MKMLVAKIAALISLIGLAVAHSSSMACLTFIIGEPKMPESLYIKD